MNAYIARNKRKAAEFILKSSGRIPLDLINGVTGETIKTQYYTSITRLMLNRRHVVALVLAYGGYSVMRFQATY